MYEPDRLDTNSGSWARDVYDSLDTVHKIWKADNLDLVCRQVEEFAAIRGKNIANQSHVYTGPDRISGG